MLLQRQLLAFNAVPANLAAGETITTTTKINPGDRVHVIWLEVGSDGATNPGTGIGTLATPGMVAAVRLCIGGVPQRTATAQELNYLNGLMSYFNQTQFAAKTSGNVGVAGYRTRLPLFLGEPWRRGSVTIQTPSGPVSIPESELGAWNLVDLPGDVTVEVDLIGRDNNGAAGIVSSPKISGFYEYDEPNGPIGKIVKWRRTNIGANADPQEITQIERKLGSYSSIHMFGTSDFHYVDSVMFTRNNKQIRQDITRFQNDCTLISRGMNPAVLDTTNNQTKLNTGAYNLVLDYDDPIRNSLAVEGVSELTLKASFDAAPAGNMTVISQILGEVEGK